MSQNDLVISNQTFPATRADITSALQALGSTNSGPSAPSTTYANMMWYDTTSNILKIRAEANDAWINIGYLDQSLDTFKILDDTVVTTAAGVDTDGIIGDQTTETWETGTGTTESLVSPAKVKAAVEALAPSSALTLGSFTSLSGTSSFEFTVPTSATEINLNFVDVTYTGSTFVQLKVGGTAVTSGYYSSSGTSGGESGSTSGFYMYSFPGRIANGVMSIKKASSTIWMETHAITLNFTEANGAGRLTGAGTVDGIKFFASSFTGGQVSVSYR